MHKHNSNPAALEDYGRIKVLPAPLIGKKNSVVVDCRAGGQVSIQLKIKNKTKNDWPKDGLTWWNDYSRICDDLPRLMACEEMIMDITFKIPKGFTGAQGKKIIPIKFNLKDKHNVIYGQRVQVTLQILI